MSTRPRTPSAPGRRPRQAVLSTVATAAAAALALGSCGGAASAPADDTLVRSTRDADRDVRVRAASRRASVTAPMPEATGAPRAAAAARPDAAAREALVFVGSDGERITAARIRDYLERKGSPLAGYAEVFVDAGIDAGVDPRLVVAISGIESTFGQRTIGNNAWGWGIYGDRVRRFPDWETAIRTYTRELGERYPVHRVDEAFARTYCPPNWQKWLSAVSGFFHEI